MRQMRVLDKYGVRGSISLSSALIDHHPEIIELCRERNWEFFSHGIYNTRYTYGLDEAQEKALIQDSIDSIRKATGEAPVGYLAPALSHSELTVDLWAEAGGTYTCDLFHDDQPTPVKVRSGKPFVSIPYSLELNDTIAYVVNKIEPRRYGQMIRDAFDRLYAEGAESGTVMCIPTHNYQVSTPHRLKAFEEALEYITGHSDVWVTTGREIADYYLKHCYAAAQASIEAVNDATHRSAR
jgi:peptidoglycan/xylan/chitin deacetylase (PgdA/CDA1 family)